MKMYRDMEENRDYTIAEIMEFYEEDNGGYDNFGQYLNACMTRNNGTLVELTTISPREGERLKEAAYDLQMAFCELFDALQIVDEGSINNLLSGHWPFAASLDEMYFIMGEFKSDIDNSLRALVRNPNA